MKTKVNRTPTDLLDDLSIFCYNLRNQDLKLQDIANIIRKDHSTVMYYLRRYESLSKFNKEFKNRMKKFNEEQFLRKMHFSKILKKGSVPPSAFYINAEKVEAKTLIKPIAGPQNYNEKDMDVIEKWLSFCAIGTTIIDTGTKMLKNKGLIHSRDGVFDLITAFKQLNKHFTGNENFDQKEIGIEDFVFTFLTSTEKQQQRVIKFQESLLRKG